MDNPWKNIDWKNTVAECDKNVIYPAYCKEKGIDISLLPEPYTGNVNSNVVFLNLNPGIGKCDVCFRFDTNFLLQTQKNLTHKLDYSMWLKDIRCKKGGIHEGCEWWRKKTQELRDTSNVPLNFFVIEFFPYHSKQAFSFPKLPSDYYRNFLLKKAMDDKKLIVVMRGEKRWYSINDIYNVGRTLKGYKNRIVLSNPQNVSFSRAKMEEKNWELLINELGKPICKCDKIT